MTFKEIIPDLDALCSLAAFGPDDYVYVPEPALSHPLVPSSYVFTRDITFKKIHEVHNFGSLSLPVSLVLDDPAGYSYPCVPWYAVTRNRNHPLTEARPELYRKINQYLCEYAAGCPVTVINYFDGSMLGIGEARPLNLGLKATFTGRVSDLVPTCLELAPDYCHRYYAPFWALSWRIPQEHVKSIHAKPLPLP